MTKRELIDQITVLNPTAHPVFLADFEDHQLAEYLEHLHWVVPDEELQATAGVSTDAPAEAVAETVVEAAPEATDAPLFTPPTVAAATA